MLATINCPVLSDVYINNFLTYPSSMEKYGPVLQEITDTIGIDVTQVPVMLYTINDAFASQVNITHQNIIKKLKLN